MKKKTYSKLIINKQKAEKHSLFKLVKMFLQNLWTTLGVLHPKYMERYEVISAFRNNYLIKMDPAENFN